jgi:drug/metabolite transporter (DMT)-like permease
VVLWEHLFLVILTSPFLVRFWRQRTNLKTGDWISLIVIGVGASAVATMLFTAAFSYGDFTTPLLLQKLQPLVVLAAAAFILRERLMPRYWRYFAAAVGGAYLITFADPFSVSVSQAAPALLALGAAALWGLGTVLGRRETQVLDFGSLTAARFAIGLPAALVITLLRGEMPSATSVTGSEVGALFLLSLVPGLIAMMVYYRGLGGTPASSATLAELAFPLTAIVIGVLVFDAAPTWTQWTGIALVAATITAMGLSSRRDPAALGVVTEDTALIDAST